MLKSSSPFPYRVVVISGYANPIHAGHCAYACQAKAFATYNGRQPGKVVFIVNNDVQVVLKKGRTLVPESDRLAVVGALRDVDRAVLSLDTDRTVCATLLMLCAEGGPDVPTHFGNGGDVTPGLPCPEETTCREHGVELLYGLGPKIQSSTAILRGIVG